MKALPFAAFSSLALASILGACSDDLSPIGSSLSRGEVKISVETLDLDLNGVSRYERDFDSRDASSLIGRISTESYGDLECAYVTRLLPTAYLGIPDSLGTNRIDSMKIFIQAPVKYLVGDTLAPQQLKIFRLTKQLPSDITNDFNPDGYYDPANPLSVKSYTLSQVKNPLYNSNTVQNPVWNINLECDLSREFALEVVDKYRNSPETFQWPQSFAQWFPGLYVEHTFGRGSAANITATKTWLYYHYYKTSKVVEDNNVVDKITIEKDSVCNFITSPAVLSANLLSYTPSASLESRTRNGECILTAPGGYLADITIPVASLLEMFKANTNALSIVSDLKLSIPAEKIESAVEIPVPPTILMVRTSDKDSFFAEQKVPDGATSFYANYNSTSGCYEFTSLREYINGMTDLEDIDLSDRQFTLVPVSIGTEEVKDSYGNTTGIKLVSCTPYISSPAMTRLRTDKANFVFTYSQQTLE